MSENKQPKFAVGDIVHVRVSGEPVMVVSQPRWYREYYNTRRFVPTKNGNYYRYEGFLPFELEDEDSYTKRRGSEAVRLAEMLKDQGIAIIEPSLKRKQEGEDVN